MVSTQVELSNTKCLLKSINFNVSNGNTFVTHNEYIDIISKLSILKHSKSTDFFRYPHIAKLWFSMVSFDMCFLETLKIFFDTQLT